MAHGGGQRSSHEHLEEHIVNLDHTDPEAIHDDTANEISGIAEKTTLANDDLFLIEDSADSNNKKKVKYSNLPAGGDTDLEFVFGEDATAVPDGTGETIWSTTLNVAVGDIILVEWSWSFNNMGNNEDVSCWIDLASIFPSSTPGTINMNVDTSLSVLLRAHIIVHATDNAEYYNAIWYEIDQGNDYIGIVDSSEGEFNDLRQWHDTTTSDVTGSSQTISGVIRHGDGGHPGAVTGYVRIRKVNTA